MFDPQNSHLFFFDYSNERELIEQLQLTWSLFMTNSASDLILVTYSLINILHVQLPNIISEAHQRSFKALFLFSLLLILSTFLACILAASSSYLSLSAFFSLLSFRDCILL